MIQFIALFSSLCLVTLPSCNKTDKLKTITFKLSQQQFSPTWTTQIVLGDLDYDGDLDAVFANMREFCYSKVWLNDGLGYFTPTDQNLTQQAHGIALGDLDSDGDLDIFITCSNYGKNNQHYHEPSKVYLNNGNAYFQDTKQDFGDLKLGGQKVDLVDIDNDGDLDATLVYSLDTPNKAFLNNGQGYYSETKLILPKAYGWHDLDFDGDTDLFLWERGKGYFVKLNNGNGGFDNHCFVQDSTAIRGLIGFADIDDDEDIDAIITNWDQNESYPSKVLINDGYGGFKISKQDLCATIGGRIGLGDINKDGSIDAVITCYEKPTQIWLNNGEGHFRDFGIKLEYNGAFHSATLGDVDLDGDLDLFIANYKGGSNQLWLNELK
jgi:hypothetical protein